MSNDATAFLLGDAPDEEHASPFFPAKYPGDCDGCGMRFDEGNMIRKGDSGWEAEQCCGSDDPSPDNPRRAYPKLPLERGRYVSTHPDTEKEWRATRVTNFIKIPLDHIALDDWRNRMTGVGLTVRPDLLAKISQCLDGPSPSDVVKRDRDKLNGVMEQARKAAGASERARHGTILHKHAEEVDAGRRTLDEVPAQYRPDIAAYTEALAASGLRTFPDLIERTICHVGLNVVGTFDRIVSLPDGTFAPADMKTGSSLKYMWLEIAMQMGIYAHGFNAHGIAVCNNPAGSGDPADWRWERPVNPDDPSISLIVREDVGLVFHLPYGERTCTIYEVPLGPGWEGAELAASIRTWRKSKVVGTPVDRPDPDFVAERDAVPTWEERAERVRSRTEASALYREARGVVDAGRLTRLVQIAKDALD